MAGMQGKELKQVIDPTLAKAFTHPLRGHVWVTVCEKGLASPTEVAEELGLDVSEVSYHFRELKRRGLIQLAHKVRRRGFDEHFYEPCPPALYFSNSDWMEIPAAMRATLSADILQRVIAELVSALGAGSFEARDRHLSRTWLTVDERGWKELMRTLQRTLDRIQGIQERAAERMKESSRPGIPVSVAMISFETSEGASPRDVESGERP